jgi:hypothetical protein
MPQFMLIAGGADIDKRKATKFAPPMLGIERLCSPILSRRTTPGPWMHEEEP